MLWNNALTLLSRCFITISLIVVPDPSMSTSSLGSSLIYSSISLRFRTILCFVVCKYRLCCSMICIISVSPKVDSFPKGMKNLLASEQPILVVKLLQRCASSSPNVCSETPGRFAILSAIHVVLNLSP
jgi:hypothetical protein